jgi:hypothetical protein
MENVGNTTIISSRLVPYNELGDFGYVLIVQCYIVLFFVSCCVLSRLSKH